ncbi:MAG: hypothetical protein R3E32_11605 [Chitinophagales bacterium]
MKILIINSQGHWLNGWMTQTSSQRIVVEILQKSGFEVETIEVSNPKQLQRALASVSSNTLVWANAYWVNADNGQLYGLIQAIERYQLPLIGSDLETLLRLLEKDICQLKLKAAGIPTPANLILHQQDKGRIAGKIIECELEYPLVLKPTKESRSQGITLVYTLEEAIFAAEEILTQFPNSHLIIEEFLAADDITCGYLRMGTKEMILPSYNVVKGMDCKTEIFSEYHYTLSSHHEKQVYIEDPSILKQLETYLPAIVELFGIQTTTRVDGRLNKQGVMNFFDINGLPGLNFPVSALVKQCFAHFPQDSQEYLFKNLIHTIVGDNLWRYNMSIPSIIQEQNLFNLESKTIITVEQTAAVK